MGFFCSHRIAFTYPDYRLYTWDYEQRLEYKTQHKQAII